MTGRALTPTGFTLAVNPLLDLGAFARVWREQGYVQIPDLFAPDVAEALYGLLEQQTPWHIRLTGPDGTLMRLDQAMLSSLKDQQIQTLLSGSASRASTDFSHCHLACDLVAGDADTDTPDYGAALAGFFTDGEGADLIRTVTGLSTGAVQDLMATCYRPGDFRALDSDTRAQAALFSLDFSRGYRADWGGQWLLHNMAGDIVTGLVPRYNLLTLVALPRRWSVAAIAPYAATPRFAVSGTWG